MANRAIYFGLEGLTSRTAVPVEAIGGLAINRSLGARAESRNKMIEARRQANARHQEATKAITTELIPVPEPIDEQLQEPAA